MIPTRQFKTEYTQSSSVTASSSSSSCVSVKYQNYDLKIPVYCFRSLGVLDVVAGELNPTLFSAWSVRASFAVRGEGDGKKISYRAVVSPSLLYVDYELEKVPIVDAQRRCLRRLASDSSSLSTASRKRALQSTVSTSSSSAKTSSQRQRCCPVGSYQYFVGDDLGCLMCPQQSVSQFGGLFCSRMAASKTAATGASSTTEDDETFVDSGAGSEADSGSSASAASADGDGG